MRALRSPPAESTPAPEETPEDPPWDIGVFTVRSMADWVEFDRATFTVTTLGEEFVTDATGETVVAVFPTEGEAVQLLWQEANQDFMLASLQ